MTTPVMKLPEITPGNASQDVVHNAALQAIEAYTVKAEAIVNAPPALPVDDGKSWIVGTMPTGVFTGKANHVAYRRGAQWVFYPPFPGLTKYVQSEAGRYTYLTNWGLVEGGVSNQTGTIWRNADGAPSDALGTDGDYYIENDSPEKNYYKRIDGAYVLQGTLAGGQGERGEDGAAGAVWRVGASAPDDVVGLDGDLYLRTSNGDVYQRAAGVYSVVANIRGPIGLTGTAGSVWRANTGAPPSPELGVNGDYYFHTPTGDIYYKSAGSYALIANIRGPASGGGGASALYNGEGAPEDTLGVDTDYYLDVLSKNLYQKLEGAFVYLVTLGGGGGGGGGSGEGSLTHGVDDPINGEGVEGSYYLQVADGNPDASKALWYLPIGDTTWVVVGYFYEIPTVEGRVFSGTTHPDIGGPADPLHLDKYLQYTNANPAGASSMYQYIEGEGWQLIATFGSGGSSAPTNLTAAPVQNTGVDDNGGHYICRSNEDLVVEMPPRGDLNSYGFDLSVSRTGQGIVSIKPHWSDVDEEVYIVNRKYRAGGDFELFKELYVREFARARIVMVERIAEDDADRLLFMVEGDAVSRQPEITVNVALALDSIGDPQSFTVTKNVPNDTLYVGSGLIGAMRDVAVFYNSDLSTADMDQLALGAVGRDADFVNDVTNVYYASHFWRMRETSGTTAVDDINGANGEYSGGFTPTADGVEMDGSAYLTIINSAMENITSGRYEQLYILMFVKTAQTDGVAEIFRKDGNFGIDIVVKMFADSGKAAVSIGGGEEHPIDENTPGLVEYEDPLNTDQWRAVLVEIRRAEGPRIKEIPE